MRTPNANRTSHRYFLRLAKFSASASIVGALFLIAGLIYLHVKAFVVPRRVPPIHTPAEINLSYEDITFTTADGLTLSGWYIPGVQPNAVILVHGVNANREALLPEAKILAKADYHLLMFDLRGHGKSEGEEMTYGYREALDVQAAVDYLLNLPDVEQVGALGTSFGGAAVIRAAAKDERLKAIVIQNSFSSLSQAVEDGFDNMAILPKWPFAPLIVTLTERRTKLKLDQVDSARDLATEVSCPVLIIHGSDDDLFPPHHARTMYASAREPKDLWIIEGLGHASPIHAHAAEYEERTLAFFEKAFSLSR